MILSWQAFIQAGGQAQRLEVPDVLHGFLTNDRFFEPEAEQVSAEMGRPAAAGQGAVRWLFLGIFGVEDGEMTFFGEKEGFFWFFKAGEIDLSQFFFENRVCERSNCLTANLSECLVAIEVFVFVAGATAQRSRR